MMLSAPVRKFALTVHLTSSVGWIGAVFAYLALGVAAATSSDTQIVRAAWTAMDLIGWWVIVPLATAALVTGLVMSLGTHWGLFRHYWVLISLGLTALCTVVLVVHMPSVSKIARVAQDAEAGTIGGDLMHPGVGLLLLLAITVLNVYKPAGVTPYGWRKQREERQRLKAGGALLRSPAPAARARASNMYQVSSPRAGATKAAHFVFHFAEMWFAMMVGMAAFMILTIGLRARGYAGLVDATSIEFQVGMGVFMIAPMSAWMRLRRCGWRECAEMSVAMLSPIAAALVMRALDLLDVSAWLAGNQHPLMLVGMLALMLCRREHYNSWYSLDRWPIRLRRRAAVRSA